MSQSRCRGQSSGAKAGARGPLTAPRPASRAPRPQGDSSKPTNHIKSNHKIPKNIRYDLENALVGLCDVWFEEIKPYLVRNKIKLHVYKAGGDTATSPQLPPGAPGCSHLDPGAASDRPLPTDANYADFCALQPTASKVRSRKRTLQCPSAPKQRPALHPRNSSTQTKEQCGAHTVNVGKRYGAKPLATARPCRPLVPHPTPLTSRKPKHPTGPYAPQPQWKSLQSPTKEVRRSKEESLVQIVAQSQRRPYKPTAPDDLLSQLFFPRASQKKRAQQLRNIKKPSSCKPSAPENLLTKYEVSKRKQKKSLKSGNDDKLFKKQLFSQDKTTDVQVLYRSPNMKNDPSVMQLVMPLKIKNKPWR